MRPSASDTDSKFAVAAPKRLDPDTEAQLACLVPPSSLPQHAFSSGVPRAPVANPSRDALKKAAAKLVATLDDDGTQALTQLLHSWYYSGFFTGQIFGKLDF